ncbi:MAG TPA: c-type cytochrome [Legionella sp.]|nr:c-type cytochrome [Legionella sp.]
MLRHFLFILTLIFLMPSFSQTHNPQEFLRNITGAKNEGKLIYDHFCANCHAKKPLISIGAPVAGDSDAWKYRLKQGLPLLLKHVDEGFNAMPPRGGCFECTDDQLLLAIITMLPEDAQKTLLNELRDHKKYKE